MKTIYDFLIEKDAFNFKNCFNKYMTLLLKHDIIGFERDESGIKFWVKTIDTIMNYKTLELTVDTDLESVYQVFKKFVKSEMEGMAKLYWKHYKHDISVSYNPYRKVVVTSIPLNTSENIRIIALIDITKEIQFEVCSWQIVEEKK